MISPYIKRDDQDEKNPKGPHYKFKNTLVSHLRTLPLLLFKIQFPKQEESVQRVTSNCLSRVLYNIRLLSFLCVVQNNSRLDYKCLVYYEGVVVPYLGLALFLQDSSMVCGRDILVQLFFNANRINVLDHANNQLEVVIAKFLLCLFVF